MKYLISLLLVIVATSSCSHNDKKERDEKILIVCTTGIIGDAVKNLVDSSVEVKSLMGPGIDPHLYKATPSDLEAFRNADIILFNGLELEGKLTEILNKYGREKSVIAMADSLDKSKLIAVSDYSYDPHIWFDVALWNEAVLKLSTSLKKYLPQKEELITRKTSKYLKELDSLQEEVDRKLKSVPKDKRILITAHDAFNYFGNAYGFEVIGLIGISTVADFGLKDRLSIVDTIIKKQVPAIFLESSTPERNIKSVLSSAKEEGMEVKLGGTLYSDALGPKGSGADNYTGMVRHNVSTIVNALK